MFCLLAAVLGLAGLAACAPGAPVASSEAQIEKFDIASAYRVGPDDQITLRVFGEPDLTGDYTVASNGTLSLPLLGILAVEGLNLSEIESMITNNLKDGYILDPKITIEIKKYRPFYILGEVRAPGSYSYVSNMNILNAVAMAGGYTYRANQRIVEVKRTHKGTTEIFKAQPVDTPVIPGDIIIIKERFF